MKYIRTKDGRIIETNNLEFELEILKVKGNVLYEMTRAISIRFEDGINKREIKWIKTEIIKQANTIEELIDEYVLVEKSARCFLNYDEITEDDLKLCLQDHDIFGAIWTDKGLIYVAKMNDKGDWELL